VKKRRGFFRFTAATTRSISAKPIGFDSIADTLTLGGIADRAWAISSGDDKKQELEAN
jgi:hypothetical protein